MKNWKITVVVLMVFVMNMAFLPGFTAMAADTVTTAQAGEVVGAEVAGAEGGMALFSGLSTGTIIAGTIGVALAVGWVAGAVNNNDNDHNATTNH
jgi:hypothetical protein